MGGYGSGRQYGRPTADLSLRIDIAWMIRTGHAIPGSHMSGTLSWSYGGDNPAGSISYQADMSDCHNAKLILSYKHGVGDKKESVQQEVRLTFTEPHYGGKRWWMTCPYRGIRVGKLYKPSGGDRFASRMAWRLGYQSQRSAERDRSFDRLFRLQKKLGCQQGYDNWPTRPKGMWQRTYDRHLARYQELDAECAVALYAMMQGGWVNPINGRLKDRI